VASTGGPPLYPSATAVLRQASRVTQLGIVTSLPAWMAGPMLESAGLNELFGAVQCAQWGVPPKPNPTGIRRVTEALAVPASETCYLGDSAVDERAALAAGTDFAWASWGYGQASPASMRLDSWQEVGEFL
jgi:phosphoglycolate phosphatase